MLPSSPFESDSRIFRLLTFAAIASLLVLLTNLILFSSNGTPSTVPQPDALNIPNMSDAFGKLPLSFEANRGQTDPQVEFVSHGPGYTLFLTSTEAVLSLPVQSGAGMDASDAHQPAEATALRMQFVGANSHPQVSGMAELPGHVNYLLGQNAANWNTNVPTYGKVRYQGLYPGVDLVYYGSQGQLEYDLEVNPGADPAAIRLRFEGADNLRLDDAGNLIAYINGERVVQRVPTIYQQIDGQKQTVAGSYILHGQNQVGFRVDDYDPTATLFVDPVVVYSTYLGGNSFDQASGVAVDDTGAVYVTGRTGSTDFPTTSGSYRTENGVDGFVFKLAPDGQSLVYSALIKSYGKDVAPDSAGNAWVVTQDDITADRLVKLSADGSALLLTREFPGGFPRAVTVDGNDDAYVTGGAAGPDFQATSGVFQPTHGGDPDRNNNDGFVMKLDAAGTVIYASYLGGSAGEEGRDIAVDANGAAYVTGWTQSLDFPTVNAFQDTHVGDFDGFVAKVNPTGSALDYSTYLGGDDSAEQATGIAVDANGAAYVTGWTLAFDFPVTPGAFRTQAPGGGYMTFMTKLTPSGSDLAYSTYAGSGQAMDIAIDTSGNAVVTGRTDSTIPTANALQSVNDGGSQDAFITKLNSTGSALVYSTYLGGSLTDEGWAIATDNAGDTYIVGLTSSYNFPTAAPLQSTLTAATEHPEEAFVTKISETAASGPLADIGISIEDSPDPVPSGQQLTYTVSVTNNGPDPASGVAARIRIDPLLSFVSGSPDQGACDWNTSECDIGSLTPGSSATITIVVDTPANTKGAVSSSGFVTVAEWDPDITNNDTREVTTLGSEPTPTPTTTPAATSTPTPTATATPAPSADTVTITLAEYDAHKQELRVQATSSDSSATLKVYVTATDELIGTLEHKGNNQRGRFTWPTNPETITVKSSLGGSDTGSVELK